MKTGWLEEYQQWSNRDLTGKHYHYLWVDGIHFNVRSYTDRQCILVIIVATESGEKEFVRSKR